MGLFKIFRAHVYVQVVFGIIIGALLGVVAPKYAVEMKFLADIFVKLIKMCTLRLVGRGNHSTRCRSKCKHIGSGPECSDVI